jgi:hypothetical protein
MEERMRTELARIRAEIPAAKIPPGSLMGRAHRAVAATIGGVVVATALVVGGSVAAWNALGSGRPSVPAARSTSPTPSRPVVTGSAAAAAALGSRPLSLPSMAPGAACRPTPDVTIRPGLGAGFSGTTLAQRAGHVFLTFAGSHVPLRPSDRTAGGWYDIKAVWVSDAAYRGPLLIRGGRIDRPGPMQFQFDPETPQQHELFVNGVGPPAGGGTPATWRSVPTVTAIRAPGCYAYQIDGIGFTRYVTFEASR